MSDAKAPIVICYDGSAGADRAIDKAAELIGPRRAIVLDVGPELTTAEGLAMLSPVVPGSAFEDLNTADALSRARVGAAAAELAGFTAEPRTVLSSPTWEGIVAVADEVDADLIVLGSRGLTGAREAFLGSISHEVAEHAGRPLLIVPPANDRG
jgi:nucleotide-binding universal stress UspA family protein